MTGKWFVTGEVLWQPRYIPAKEEGKRGTWRVRIISENSTGSSQGVPRYRKDYITLVGFGDIGVELGKLKKGDMVEAEGRPQAGRPWVKGEETPNPKMYADQELLVDSWGLLISASPEDAVDTSGYQAPDDTDGYIDPFDE